MHSLAETLAKIPRIELIDEPTPIQRLYRVEDALGDAAREARLFVKRTILWAWAEAAKSSASWSFLSVTRSARERTQSPRLAVANQITPT